MERAKENGQYVVMVVEADINDALGFNFSLTMRWTKASPEHIFSNLEDILLF